MSTISTKARIYKSKLSLTDYPKFNGKQDSWYTFRDEMEAIAIGQGLGWIFEIQSEEDIELYGEDFKFASQFLYSVLQCCCTSGLAISKVKPFKKTRDGYQAWQTLVEHYDSHGSREQHVSELTMDLTKLRLEYNSHGGLERYISDFEKICLQLDEAGHPESDLQKKTKFLAGINDTSLTHICTYYRFDSSISFQDTTKHLMAGAKALGKLNKGRSDRNANQAQRGRKGKGTPSKDKSRSKIKTRNANNASRKDEKSDDGMGLPSDLWKKMTGPQRKAYLEGRGKLRNAQPQETQNYGGQYSSTANSASRTSNPTSSTTSGGTQVFSTNVRNANVCWREDVKGGETNVRNANVCRREDVNPQPKTHLISL